MNLRQFGGIACIPELRKLDPFDDTITVHVEASDDAFGQHVRLHKSSRAVGVQLPQIFRDETELRRGGRAPWPRKNCCRMRTKRQSICSAEYRTSARSRPEKTVIHG